MKKLEILPSQPAVLKNEIKIERKNYDKNRLTFSGILFLHAGFFADDESRVTSLTNVLLKKANLSIIYSEPVIPLVPSKGSSKTNACELNIHWHI